MTDDAQEPDAQQLKVDVPLQADLSVPQNATRPTMTAADVIAEADSEIRREKAAQERQNTFWRRLLFWSVGSTVIVMAVANLSFMVWYLTDGNLNPVVLSTWIVGSVAQVIGLLLVITRHLFPYVHGHSD